MVIRHPLTLQATYSELVSRLQQAEMDSLYDAEAVPRLLEHGDRRYWYLRRQIGGRRRDTYLGPDSPELRERIERLRGRHLDAKSAARDRRSLIRALVAGGYPRTDARVGAILDNLSAAGVFRLYGVLVGTHAFRLYGPLLGIEIPEASAATSDVDIAQAQNVSVAVGDVTDPDFESALQKVERFIPVPTLRNNHRSSRWHTADQAMTVELLTPNTGSETDELVELRALGAFAQPLRFLDFLIRNPVDAAALYGDGVLVKVPDPVRYACHKLIVARRRSAAGQSKIMKDIAQSAALLRVLLEDRPGDVEDLFAEMLGRGPHWRRDGIAGAGMLPDDVRGTLKDRGLLD